MGSQLRPQSWDSESNVKGRTPSSNVTENSDEHQKPGWRKFLAFMGPGFLVSLAYLDPGNLETDLQAGANHRYELLWVVLIGLIFALIIQSLAANLGVSTGKHLSELCKVEYPKYVNYALWLLAEIAVIAADIPEDNIGHKETQGQVKRVSLEMVIEEVLLKPVNNMKQNHFHKYFKFKHLEHVTFLLLFGSVIGTAFALNILFHIPIWIGVLFTGFSTLLLLGLQRYGVRKLEMLIAVLVFIMAGCFFGEMSYAKPPAIDVLKGMFIPKLNDEGATGDAIALFGALVMPHNLFLHSALVLSRKVPTSIRGINDACRYFLIESGFALFVAFLINVAVISVAGTICSVTKLSAGHNDQCSNITLNSASFLLKNVLGKSSSIIYAIALLASGQSSSITGTYAGQFIMQGFLEMKMKRWVRNLITRCIAIIPSLIVSMIGGPQGAGKLIIITSMILSFELPFALIPLLKFSSSSSKMGPHKNSIYIIVISWILGLAIIGINLYFLSTAFVGWLMHNHLPKVENVVIGVIVFPLMTIYVLTIIYLLFRKDTVATFIDPTKDASIAQAHIEKGLGNPSGSQAFDRVPYREDLADIPLRE